MIIMNLMLKFGLIIGMMVEVWWDDLIETIKK